LLAGVDLAGVRQACGFTQEAIAVALGVTRPAVWAWEQRRCRPSEAYFRVVTGLMRHLAVTWDEPP
jgi:DNA-binding transcriptional regulator YiaG